MSETRDIPPKAIRMDKLKIHCKGCSLKTKIEETNKLVYCIIASYNKPEKCPCGKCLVRIMCSERGSCNKRIKFIGNMNFEAYGIQPRNEYPNNYEVIMLNR